MATETVKSDRNFDLVHIRCAIMGRGMPYFREFSVWCPYSMSTPHLQTPILIKSCSKMVEILLRSCSDVHFAVLIVTSLKIFFPLWVWTGTITRPDVKI
jgi:hypothetical protein